MYYEVIDCIPGCMKKGVLNDACWDIPGKNYKPCAPGLKCNDVNTCVLDETSCARFQHMQDKPKWLPSCLPDGSYAPKQCKGERQNGRCYCYNADGKRIFGQEWSYKAEDMECACSRRRSELEKQGRTDVTLHCDKWGNYEPLQCDSGSCWCAETKTGEVLESVVPEQMMSVLPCYNHTLVGDQYLRQCESHIIAQAKIKLEFIKHGTNHVNLPFLMCDYDGSFGGFRIDNGNAYCIWRDNSRLEASMNAAQGVDDMNCNCIRDRKIYDLAGVKLVQQCKGNGNYEKLQQIDGDKFYCVDSDGFATTEPIKGLKVEDCPLY
ncbi:hypothetical protein CBL_08001 [Carabus blaptoides fortunei]